MRDKSFFKSEADFIAWIRRRTPRRVAGLTLGIGDDAALVAVPPGQELILTTDMSIEGVHFTSALHPPQAVGHRALARSLSDIAAMGGTPRYALISLAVSRRTGRAWLEGFFDGLFALARRFAVAVIGGDTAIVDGPCAVDVIVAGEVPRGRALRRSGAQPGDRIFVSGRLGMAALGLRLLPSRTRLRKPVERAALRAHLFPQPQCALGRFLSEHRLASAMMDLSDGLSIDLRAALRCQRGRSEFVRRSSPHPSHPRCRGRPRVGASRRRRLPIAFHRLRGQGLKDPSPLWQNPPSLHRRNPRLTRDRHGHSEWQDAARRNPRIRPFCPNFASINKGN